MIKKKWFRDRMVKMNPGDRLAGLCLSRRVGLVPF